MANHKSALKRHRQSSLRRTRNRGVRSRVRVALKLAKTAITEESSEAPELVKKATILLDRAVSKNVLPGKQVARLKSRLSIRLNRMNKPA